MYGLLEVGSVLARGCEEEDLPSVSTCLAGQACGMSCGGVKSPEVVLLLHTFDALR